MGKKVLDQSSLYEPKETQQERKAKSPTKPSGKENDALESSIIVVTKTYKRKEKLKPSVSFQTSPTSKKPTKKEKRLEEWASLQTSHFSEIDEFDISSA